MEPSSFLMTVGLKSVTATVRTFSTSRFSSALLLACTVIVMRHASVINKKRVGELLKLKLWRAGKELEISATLTEQSAE